MMMGIVASTPIKLKRDEDPEIILQTEIIEFGEKVEDGQLIRVCLAPWLALFSAFQNDENVIHYLTKNPRKFEEFIAAAYDADGWDEVILTPRSNDGGRDVIAIKNGSMKIRVLDQAKAYNPGHLVTHNDVRAMLGVLQLDSNSSKGIVTTTSDFAPTINSDPVFNKFMPYRLELKNGENLKKWLKSIVSKTA